MSERSWRADETAAGDPAADGAAADGAAADGAAADDDRVGAFVGQLLGGRVVKVERLRQKRPSWIVEVNLPNGGTVAVRVREERRRDAVPEPSRQREADTLRVIEAGGLPVHHVYGICPDPLAVVMDHLPGTDAQTGPQSERWAAGEHYMTLLDRLHALAVAPFAAIGLNVADTPERIGLAMLDAYLPGYRLTKAGPDPLVEFAIGWARRNVPQNRSRAAFIHGNVGRFLHDKGRVTALYDFRRSIIGDPIMDLAALRLRHRAEPLGDDFGSLLRIYQSVSAEPIELDALRFHTAMGALIDLLASAPAPPPNIDAQRTPSEADQRQETLGPRRTLVFALAECMGVPIEAPGGRPPSRTPSSSIVSSVINDSLAQLRFGTGMDRYKHYASEMLLGCVTADDEPDRAIIDEYATVLGHRPSDLRLTAAAMERFVLAAGAESDEALLRCFALEIEQLALALQPVAASLADPALTPIEL